jgi:hypothetical protein
VKGIIGDLEPGKHVPLEALASIPVFDEPVPVKDKWGTLVGDQYTVSASLPFTSTGFNDSSAKIQLFVSADNREDTLTIWPPPVFQTVEAIEANTDPFKPIIDPILNSLSKHERWTFGATTCNCHYHYAIPFPNHGDVLQPFKADEYWADCSHDCLELETDDPTIVASWLRALEPIREDELKVGDWLQTRQYERH